MKCVILRYKNSFQRSLIFGPVVFGIAYGVMVLALVWKGTPKLGLDKIPDNQVVAIVLGTWACSMVATYFWVSLPLYRYHWLGQDLRWYDYLLGGFAPARPVREGFDASHLEALTGKGLFNSELDEAFYSAQREIEAYNAKVEADKAAAAAAAKAAAADAEKEASEASGSSTPTAADDVETAPAAAAAADKSVVVSDKAKIDELTVCSRVVEVAALPASR